MWAGRQLLTRGVLLGTADLAGAVAALLLLLPALVDLLLQAVLQIATASMQAYQSACSRRQMTSCCPLSRTWLMLVAMFAPLPGPLP